VAGTSSAPFELAAISASWQGRAADLDLVRPSADFGEGVASLPRAALTAAKALLPSLRLFVAAYLMSGCPP
jgi:hypothetical protein